MIDTAGDVCAAAERLVEAGATDVWAMATHPVLSDPALDRLKASPICRVIVTDTLPLARGASHRQDRGALDRRIIADAIDAVFEDTSVSEIFGGQNLP